MLKFKVLSRGMSMIYELQKPHVAISMNNTIYRNIPPTRLPYERGIPIFPDNEHRLDTYTVYCDDVGGSASSSHGMKFKPGHAREILEFVDKYKDKIEYVMVHCEAGMSRSPAVAKALSETFGGNYEQMSKDRNFAPNEWIYDTMKYYSDDYAKL